jgi:hypothetical protein
VSKEFLKKDFGWVRVEGIGGGSMQGRIVGLGFASEASGKVSKRKQKAESRNPGN